MPWRRWHQGHRGRHAEAPPTRKPDSHIIFLSETPVASGSDRLPDQEPQHERSNYDTTPTRGDKLIPWPTWPPQRHEESCTTRLTPCSGRNMVTLRSSRSHALVYQSSTRTFKQHHSEAPFNASSGALVVPLTGRVRAAIRT